MLGRNHLITNISVGILTAEALNVLKQHSTISFVQNFATKAMSILFSNPITVCVGIVLFILGSLFPDIDYQDSILGKVIYVPVRHRTWTHAIWLPLILSILCFKWSVLIYFVYGDLLHIFFDNFSYGGVCFLYPFTNYLRHESGAFVKKNHYLKIYRTGDIREHILVIIIVALTCVATYYWLFYNCQMVQQILH